MAKSKSSSRTSTSKKNNLKLKWWYVLPVILVVAIAGYAIVRFSEASTYKSSKTIGNGLVCTGKVVDKGVADSGAGRSCNITGLNQSAKAEWDHTTNLTNNYGKYGEFCARVFFSAGARISMRSELKGWTVANPVKTIEAYRPTQMYDNVCISRAGGDISSFAVSTSATLEIKNIAGGATVVRMFVQ